MACSCGCDCNIKITDITDEVVRQEITAIQNKINNAICNNLNMVKVSDTYMTDMNYSEGSDIESKLTQEIQDRKEADDVLSERIDEEIEARETAISETFNDIKSLIDNEATLREEADAYLQSQIDDMESGASEEIDSKIEIAVKKIDSELEDIRKQLASQAEDCENAWKREQARAISVEENLQKQIYEITNE